MPRHHEHGSIWPKVLLLVIVCAAVGGPLGYFFAPRLPSIIPEPKHEDTTVDATRNLSRMSRSELEHEIKRLNDTIAVKDRQIGELTIQLKLATEGSRTR